MKRREFMAGSATAGAALRATDVPASTLVPCINQVTTLEPAPPKVPLDAPPAGHLNGVCFLQR